MIERVTRDLQGWLAAGLDVKRVAINVSNLELRADDYSERLMGTLQERGITCDRFEIEVTETAAFDDNIAAIGRNLRSLAAGGISIALDDFGTGYSSLGYLRDFPVDGIKIDRAFVGQLHSDPADRAIVEAVVLMARALHLHVVAEGVERTEQRTLEPVFARQVGHRRALSDRDADAHRTEVAALRRGVNLDHRLDIVLGDDRASRGAPEAGFLRLYLVRPRHERRDAVEALRIGAGLTDTVRIRIAHRRGCRRPTAPGTLSSSNRRRER
jgi:hypothetical protein